MAHLQAVLPILKTINTVTFPGITPESRSAIQQLLDDNRKHHIFFNDQRFHNHVVHHLLDSYALGCSAERLHAIYKEHTKIQRPAPPRSVKITESNWKEYIGQADRWTDYMDFFSSEVQELGIEGALDKYMFNPDLFGRFFSGVHHGIIHLGFGIVFQEPLIVAEGIAMAALEENLQFTQDLQDLSTPSSYTSLHDIFEQVRKDERLKVAPGGYERHLQTFTKVALLHEYISKWEIKGTEGDVAAKAKELIETIVLLFAATPGKKTLFDFFLMHSLTSSVFVHEIIQHVPPHRGVRILQAHFGATLVYYVASGRPAIHVENLKIYKTQLPTSPNPWLEIVKFAIETNDVHATKVAYSLLQFESWFGNFDGIFLKASQIFADAVIAGPQEGPWAFDGLGFDQKDQNGTSGTQ